MRARSTEYIDLKNIFRSKAKNDIAEVLQTVRALETELGRAKPVSEQEVDTFCKNAGFVRLIRGQPLLTAHSKERMGQQSRAQAVGASFPRYAFSTAQLPPLC